MPKSQDQAGTWINLTHDIQPDRSPSEESAAHRLGSKPAVEGQTEIRDTSFCRQSDGVRTIGVR
jgi:hypothetical protein